MSAQPKEMSREEQIDASLSLTGKLREQGWSKVSIAITRGGTFRVEAEAGDGGVKSKHDWKP